MNLNKARIGLLVPTPTPIWTGTANGAQSASFVLAVTTVTGTLSSGMVGMVIVRAGVDMVRIKSISGSNITLAENAVVFAASDAVAIYAMRLPFPRYQRLVSTTVYKDYDVAYPETWNNILPPTAVVTPEAAWVKLGTTKTFDARASQIMSPDYTVGLTAAWDATGWATTSAYGSGSGVTNCYCDLTPTSSGFHYLKLTVTDEFSGATSHYIPVWVGATYINVLEFSMNWSLERGWRGNGSTDTEFSYLAHSPVAIVDLDTREIVLFGFLNPQSIDRAFGIETFNFEILSPLEDARLLQGFPFIVTDIADPVGDVPDNWAEVGELTVSRAAWYLLVWHTMLPQLTNIDLGVAAERRIKGQKFPAGNVPSLLSEVIRSAFYVLRSARSGGVELGKHPLYTTIEEWTTPFATFDLSSAVSRDESYALQLASPRAMDVRLSGVYLEHTGDYLPAICRCPTHPANWGSGATSEVTNLAPVSEVELLTWAGRHFAVENTLDTLELSNVIDVDPFSYELLTTGISEAPTIAIEEARLSFNDGRWNSTLTGKPYGSTPTAVSVPVPSPVSIPAPTSPPTTPPIAPLPPLPPPCEWPLRVYVATRERGVYYTNNFSGPDGSQPTWQRLTGTDAYPIIQAEISQSTESVFAVCDTGTYNDLYRWTGGGGWECILTRAEAVTIMGEVGGNIKWVTVASNGNVYVLCSGVLPSTAGTVHLLVSTVDGARIVGAPSFTDGGMIAGWMYEIGNLIECATYAAAAMNKTGGGGSGRVYTGLLGGLSWKMSATLGGSSWIPSCYYDAHNDKIYAGTSTSVMSRLASDFYTWDYPAGVVGLAGILPRMAVSFPCFYAWNTNLHVTIGTGTYANSIQSSTDFWETFATSGDVGRTVDMLVGISTNPQNLILGRWAASGGAGEYHVIYVNDDLGATQPVERAGVDPNNTSTTVSIPSNCGGIARNGVLLPPDYCEVPT